MALIDEKIAQFIIDADLAHDIVHGGPTETVTTEGGPVRTFAKIDADLATPDGASLIGYGTTTVADLLTAQHLADYTVLRAYTGDTTTIRIVSLSGIAGIFKWDSADTTSADNGGTIIVASNGKRWKRVFDGAVQAEWFGVVADNGVTDNTVAINTACNYVSSLGGGFLDFDSGYYGCRDVSVPGKVILRGKGRMATKLLFKPSGVDATDASSYVVKLNGDRNGLHSLGVTGRAAGATLSSVAIGNGVRVDPVGLLPDVQDVLVDYFAGYKASPAGGIYGVRQGFSRSDMTDDAGNYLLTGGNAWVTDSDDAHSHYFIKKLEVMYCDGKGFVGGLSNDSWIDVVIGFCGNVGLDFRGTTLGVTSNNRFSGKVYLCNVLNMMDSAASLRTTLIPNQATLGADYGAVILTGQRHDVTQLEVQENGSTGIQFGTLQHCISDTVIRVVADGNGGYIYGTDTTTRDNYRRPGARFFNYYNVTGVIDAADFRTRYGWGRQKTGLYVQGTSPTFNSVGTPNLTVGDWYRIIDNSGGADFTGAQVGVAAPSNAIGTVFQASLNNTVSGNPVITWGTGVLQAVNDGLNITLIPTNNCDQMDTTGPGYFLGADGGNGSFYVADCPMAHRLRFVSATASTTAGRNTAVVVNSAGSITVSSPTSPQNGDLFGVFRGTNTTNSHTIARTAPANITGAATSLTMRGGTNTVQGQFVVFQYDSVTTNWFIIASGGCDFGKGHAFDGLSIFNGSAQFNGAVRSHILPITSTASSGAVDHIVTLSGTFTYTLTQTASIQQLVLHNIGAGTITLTVSAGSLVGVSSLSAGELAFAYSNGTDWNVKRFAPVTYPATDITNTPAGSIAATTVQAAINELDTEKVGSVALAASGGSALAGHIAIGTGATARTVETRLREINVPIAGYDTPANALAAAQTDKNFLQAGAVTYALTATLDVDGTGETISGLKGRGQNRTIFSQGTDNTPGVSSSGRFMHLSGFSIEAASDQTYADTNGANLLLENTFTFSSVRDLWLLGGYYGIQCIGTGSAQQYNCTFDNIRVSDWYKAAWSYGNGSGSFYSNHYASAIGRDAVDMFLVCDNINSEFVRMNMERATVRDKVVSLSIADCVSFLGLNMEEVSIISKGSTALNAQSLNPAFFFSSGRGTVTVRNWFMDSVHVGGYMVTSLTRVGTTATAVLNMMEFQQKLASGHGIRVGDTIFNEGAADAAYNGAFTVTAVTLDSVTFEVVGSPVTPAEIEAGADCIVISLGNTLPNSIPLVHLSGGAQNFVIDGLHMRDMRVIAKNASRRSTLLRAAKYDTGAGRVFIKNLTFGEQLGAYTHWLEPRKVTGYSRTANVATMYFNRPHNMRADTILNVYGCTADASFNGKTAGSLTAASRFAVSFANVGADVALTRETAGAAIMQSLLVTNVSRVGNVATVEVSAAHGLDPGLQIAGQFADPTYNTSNALVLSTPTDSSFTYRCEQADSASAADTGSIMVMEGGLATSTIEEGTPMVGLLELGDLDEYCGVFAPGAVAAGATGVNTYNVQRATVARDAISYRIIGGDSRLTYSVIVSATNQVQVRAFNPTGGSITPTPCEVRFKVDRQ